MPSHSSTAWIFCGKVPVILLVIFALIVLVFIIVFVIVVVVLCLCDTRINFVNGIKKVILSIMVLNFSAFH